MTYYVAIGGPALRDGPEGDSFKVFTDEKEAADHCFDKGAGWDEFTVFKLVPVAEYEVEYEAKLKREEVDGSL